jgi:glycerate kinase
MDIQTLQGKGPFGVYQQAERYSIPVVGLAGRIEDQEKLLPYFIRLISINEEDTDIETALKNTYSNLEKAARLLGDQIFLHLT